ncbi:FAD/NAD(P)-binding protein [Formosa sp. S-31]|uniref:FAD/NAD(P)-binding protein n=1 Tax=Formosa sp. S-31 TaxID=2790949 RepID=UPI003EC0DE62
MQGVKEVSDIVFVGSGIASGFTLLHIIKTLSSDCNSPNLKITLIDKYGDFFKGIPYGKRSGDTVLLINSLKSFLPEDERKSFILWIKDNKESLISNFLDKGGREAKRWFEANKNEINQNKWDDLFVPRTFFGNYISEILNKAIEKAISGNIINLNFITSEVIDYENSEDISHLILDSGEIIQARSTVLCVGSLPYKKICEIEFGSESSDMLLINDLYSPGVDENINKIEDFIKKRRKDKETNVLVIGANASGLEAVYKLNSSVLSRQSINNYVMLSTNGVLPESNINSNIKNEYNPSNLLALQKKKQIEAIDIREAAIKDIKKAQTMGLGVASTVGVISDSFKFLLDKLDEIELENFACKYGNEIGKHQRCAGGHYTSVVDELKQSNKFTHLTGRFSEIRKTEKGRIKLVYEDSLKKEHLYPIEFDILINCMGSINFEDSTLPPLLKNLKDKNYIQINLSKIGIKTNNFEASRNLYVMGPLLAGNVIDGKALWHLEHCGRIIWTSNLLSRVLVQNQKGVSNRVE